MRLNNKISLITGGAKGIGKSCAQLMAKEGAIVIISDICDEEGTNLAKEIGENATYHTLDVSKESEWISIMDFIKKLYGRLDILVNNAGITGFDSEFGPQDPEHTSFESWHKVHSINLDGVFLGCKYAIQLMKEGKSGSIINISSRSGLVGIPRAAAYASSKAAIRNHTKTVALYCAEEAYDIRCNSIHPGAILTAMWNHMLGHEDEKRKQAIAAIAKEIPLKRMGEPIDVAYAVVYLGSDESKFITGTELNIDGGILAGATATPK